MENLYAMNFLCRETLDVENFRHGEILCVENFWMLSLIGVEDLDFEKFPMRTTLDVYRF